MREAYIQKDIQDFLESEGWLVVKIIQTNKNGWPDLQAHKYGQTIFIEVKRPGGKVSELQKYRHEQLRQEAFHVFISTSLNQLQNELTQLGETLRQQRLISNLN